MTVVTSGCQAGYDCYMFNVNFVILLTCQIPGLYSALFVEKINRLLWWQTVTTAPVFGSCHLKGATQLIAKSVKLNNFLGIRKPVILECLCICL